MSDNKRKYSSYSKRHRRYLVATETQNDLDRFRYVDDNDDNDIQFCEDLEGVTAIHHSSTDNLHAASSSSSQSNSDNPPSKSDLANNESDYNVNSDSDTENCSSDDDPLSDDKGYGCDWFDEDNINAAGSQWKNVGSSSDQTQDVGPNLRLAQTVKNRNKFK
ncbi:uncharacterized protein LOC114932803 isoform X2 [Nylanderia fulva]|uniref:uncharacterized protein LOC114932803 isoform X2 n=1 Tax=Nylanderia fulva TaxID=613905 RepID=UPI0010FB5BDF|nr:uncharacterized protein LOC114932803 isoform X2 [Nylanderia fulva]XP_029161038.1 uncharacterized protein LOC114932803 isoform X2 [Nylanderia fulva]